jgi:hypothetical protein
MTKKNLFSSLYPQIAVILPCIVCYTLILDVKTLYIYIHTILPYTSIYYIAIQRCTPIRFRLDSHRLPIKPIVFLVNHPKKGYST